MPDHVMNYIECDAADATLVEWRRSRNPAVAAAQDKAKRRVRLPSLKSFIPALTPAPAF